MKMILKEPIHSHQKLFNGSKQQQKLEHVAVLNYIDPARQILEGNWRFNSLYAKQISPLPPIMQYSQQLYALGPLNPMSQQYLKLRNNKRIFQKNMNLIINPFETRQYFKNNRNNHSIFQNNKQETVIHKEGQLVFDSYFQSGNLLKVDVQPFNHNYHLTMQNDINTFGCTQWFFFKGSNKQCVKATFFINNFYKPRSLYQKGMKIMIFSKKKSIKSGTGWVRGGDQIMYFKNCTSQNINNRLTKNFYTLKFSYYFQHQEDEVYFAYTYPYTYSRLNSFINETLSDNVNIITHKMLCKTIAENKVSLLTITNPKIDKSEKKSIFISARVHPGESVSSLVMQGIISFLVGNCQMAQKLRDNFIFKLIPMLNPDGVIHGNYRTNLAGFDLNRVWQNPDKKLCPQIFQLKKYIIQYQKQCPTLMFCDLHGHSTKKSAFFYGCSPQRIKRKKKSIISQNMQVKLFPYMLSKMNDDLNYKHCDFSVAKNKQGTARVQLWKQLGIPNIFTLETSFCSKQNSQYHFRPKDYKEIGQSFCRTLYQYFFDEKFKQTCKSELKSYSPFLFSTSKDIESDDSDSDNDLFNQQTRKKLADKNLGYQTMTRSLVIDSPDQKSRKAQNKIKKNKAQSNYRRTIMKKNKTDISQSFETQRNKSKIVYEDFPVSKIFIETQCLKNNEAKLRQNRRRLYTQQSFLQKVEHTYRGKSSLYRIKRQQLFSIQPQKKSSVYRLDYFS